MQGAVILTLLALASTPLERGIEAYQAEDYETAITELKVAVAETDGSEPYLLMREAYEAAYGVDGAVEKLEAEVNANVDDALARNNLACFYMRQHRWQEARNMLLSALKIDDQEVDARFNLAFLMAQLGQTKGALEHYEGILERYPEHTRALSEICFLISEREGEPSRAEPYCERAAASAPGDANTAMNWGLVRMRMGDLQGAERVFSDLSERHEGTSYATTAQTYLGYVALQQGKLEAAEQTFKQVLEDAAPADTGEALVGLARVYQSRGEYAKSANHYRRAYKLTGSGMLLGAMVKVYLQRYFYLVIGLLLAVFGGLLWRYLGPRNAPTPPKAEPAPQS